jgi:uncharacterized cupredoxin-like copper-binding protein
MKRLIASSAVALLALAGAEFGPAWLLPAFAHGEHTSGHSAHSFEAGEPGDPGKPFRTVEVLMQEGDATMSFAPIRIEARKGDQIKFVLRNEGQLDHEFLIDSFANNQKHKAEMENRPDMEHEEPNGARLRPAARTELLWRFTRVGTFEFACLIPGHYEAGMKGVVVVR